MREKKTEEPDVVEPTAPATDPPVVDVENGRPDEIDPPDYDRPYPVPTALDAEVQPC